MTAISADFQRSSKMHKLRYVAIPVKDDAIIFVGGMVNIVDASGLAVDATDAAAQSFAGVCVRKGLDNTNGGDGTITGSPTTGGLRTVDVDQQGLHSFALSGAAPLVGAEVYMTDNGTIQAAANTNGIKVGKAAEPDLINAPNWFIDIEGYCFA